MSVDSVRLNCGQSVCRLSSDSVTALLVQVERHTLTGGPHPAIAGSNVIVKPQTWQFSQRSIVRPHTYSVAAVGSRDRPGACNPSIACHEPTRFAVVRNGTLYFRVDI